VQFNLELWVLKSQLIFIAPLHSVTSASEDGVSFRRN